MSIEKIIIPAALLVPCGVVAQDKAQDVKQSDNSQPISRTEIEKRVIKIISKHIGIPATKIKSNMSFTNDLGADSLDLVEMVMAIEKEFSISIVDSLLEKIVTVEHTVTAVDGLLNVNRDVSGNASEEQTASDVVKKMKLLAEEGDPLAQCHLALLYQEGLMGVSKDLNLAFQWYSKSAAQGFAVSQYELGNMYFSGEGVKKDYVKSVEWLRKAANQGLPEAQYNLACKYGNGEGVKTDMSEAVKWFKKAAAQGYQKAIDVLDRIESEQ
jgi:acyl carrier protein